MPSCLARNLALLQRIATARTQYTRHFFPDSPPIHSRGTRPAIPRKSSLKPRSLISHGSGTSLIGSVLTFQICWLKTMWATVMRFWVSYRIKPKHENTQGKEGTADATGSAQRTPAYTNVQCRSCRSKWWRWSPTFPPPPSSSRGIARATKQDQHSGSLVTQTTQHLLLELGGVHTFCAIFWAVSVKHTATVARRPASACSYSVSTRCRCKTVAQKWEERSPSGTFATMIPMRKITASNL